VALTAKHNEAITLRCQAFCRAKSEIVAVKSLLLRSRLCLGCYANRRVHHSVLRILFSWTHEWPSSTLVRSMKPSRKVVAARNLLVGGGAYYLSWWLAYPLAYGYGKLPHWISYRGDFGTALLLLVTSVPYALVAAVVGASVAWLMDSERPLSWVLFPAALYAFDKDRLEAIRLPMHVEGLMEAGETPGKASLDANSEPNNQAMRELLELARSSRTPETSEGLPEH